MRLCLEKAEVYNNSGNRFLEHEMFSNSLLPLEQHECLHEQPGLLAIELVREAALLLFHYKRQIIFLFILGNSFAFVKFDQ